mmetsp:Transcript_16931/g.28000  ORF Transcript_16931/g.28000 Transcript_16931/m.28000 type:complete len:80 (-) Transcript_16931:611-850(-)
MIAPPKLKPEDDVDVAAVILNEDTAKAEEEEEEEEPLPNRNPEEGCASAAPPLARAPPKLNPEDGAAAAEEAPKSSLES